MEENVTAGVIDWLFGDCDCNCTRLGGYDNGE